MAKISNPVIQERDDALAKVDRLARALLMLDPFPYGHCEICRVNLSSDHADDCAYLESMEHVYKLDEVESGTDA